MFVGRHRELKKLEDLYSRKQFEFVVFYGRRRVGKTTLINEFLKGKKAVYYMSVEGTKTENLSGLSKALLLSETQSMSLPAFADCESLLGFKIHPFTFFESKEMVRGFTEAAINYAEKRHIKLTSFHEMNIDF